MSHILVINTCPDLETARKLAQLLVQQRLAACVNIVPTVHSVYEWKGELQQEAECLLYIKSRTERYAELEAALRANHPYELPEIIAVPINTGLAPYLTWIDQQTEQQQ